jgi:hypothetical protein
MTNMQVTIRIGKSGRDQKDVFRIGMLTFVTGLAVTIIIPYAFEC